MKISRAASIVASWSSSLEPKWANSPLLLMSSSVASRPIVSPPRPSTEARSTAVREDRLARAPPALAAAVEAVGCVDGLAGRGPVVVRRALRESSTIVRSVIESTIVRASSPPRKARRDDRPPHLRSRRPQPRRVLARRVRHVPRLPRRHDRQHRVPRHRRGLRARRARRAVLGRQRLRARVRRAAGRVRPRRRPARPPPRVPHRHCSVRCRVHLVCASHRPPAR